VRAIVAALIVAVLAPAAHAGMASVGMPVMGTVLEVTVVAADDVTARRLADAAIAEARRWDDVLSTWREDAELARFNARAGSGPVAVSATLAAALSRMQALSAATGGSFDPVSGALSRHWREEHPGTPARIVDAQRHRIARALTLQGQSAALAQGTAVDSGGIGKGMALDAIATMLRAGAATSAFLDFGGSSQLAIGAPPASPQGWKVVVAGLVPGDVAGMLLLRDRSISTSRAIGAGKAGPILDPEVAAPVPPPRVATVVAADATTAEAWSKVAIIQGRASIERAAKLGVEVFYEDTAGPARSPTLLLEALPD